MKKNLKKLFLLINCCALFCVFVMMLFAGCQVNPVENNSSVFSFSEPVYKSNEEDSHCAIGGVYFDFYNKADCKVIYIEVKMNVYDKKTRKPAFTGYGTITCGNEIIIKSEEKRQICIPLDDYISVVSKSGYLIDQFYVSRVELEDGRVFCDLFGLNAVSSGE